MDLAFIYYTLKQNMANYVFWSPEYLFLDYFVISLVFLMQMSMHQHLPFPALNKTTGLMRTEAKTFANVKGIKILAETFNMLEKNIPHWTSMFGYKKKILLLSLLLLLLFLFLKYFIDCGHTLL